MLRLFNLCTTDQIVTVLELIITNDTGEVHDSVGDIEGSNGGRDCILNPKRG